VGEPLAVPLVTPSSASGPNALADSSRALGSADGAPSFSSQLAEAVSAFSRRQSQTAFLLSQTVAESRELPTIDEQQRLLVSRNAAMGYCFVAPQTAAVPAPALQTVPARPKPQAQRPDPGTTTNKVDEADLNADDVAPLAIDQFPRPANDNGRGVHWVPTTSSRPEVVDELVSKAVQMGMKWVVFLNDGASIGANDYLVQRLTANGIMPVLRVYTNGLQPITGDLEAMVRHYNSLGVSYFQLYNEPNLKVETGGQQPDVKRYLDLWIPAAKQVIAAGGLPGIGALSPQGDVDDRQFLAETLAELQARGETRLLNRTWLAVHNYTGPRDFTDPDGFLRYRQYDAIIRSILGHSLPMVGTEGGTQLGPGVTEEKQVQLMTQAYRYMESHPDPYNFAYTYWIIANEAGGGKDPAFSQHALIRPDGPTALAQALTRLA